MTKFKKSNYMFWHSPFALVLFCCVLIFFGYRIVDLVQKERETAYEKELALDRISDLQKREVSLTKDIARLGTQEGKEEIIREKYQVAKPNEKMVTIVDESKNDNHVETEVVSHGFWNWVKRIFNK